jgi:signal transduction histidine kinase
MNARRAAQIAFFAALAMASASVSAQDAKKGLPANPVGAGTWTQTVNKEPVAGADELQLDKKQIELLQKVNTYFNQMPDLKGTFVQTSPDNKRTRGKFYVQRPGKFRFDYAPPSRLLILSDGDYLVIQDSDGAVRVLPLEAKPVCFFYADVMAALAAIDPAVHIWPQPQECPVTTPFTDDREHAHYDRAAVQQFWQALRAEPRLLQCFTAPVLDSQDRLLGRMLVFRDITREREVEQMKTDFVSIVSHELRTPLTSIIGYGELLAESEADRLTDQGRRYLDVIRRNAQREMRLVGDLLLLVRIQEGTFRIEPEEVDLRRIVEQAVEAARPAAAKREIQLTANASSTPSFEGDPHRLGQVVDNLLSNAIKFTPKGGEVSVRLGSSNGVAAIEVTDTGTGIPEDEQEFLFDRLYRASSAAASAVPGVGLGLTIVKAIVDAHDGRVTLESEPGVGATFRVELPVDGSQPEAEEAPEQ